MIDSCISGRTFSHVRHDNRLARAVSSSTHRHSSTKAAFMLNARTTGSSCIRSLSGIDLAPATIPSEGREDAHFRLPEEGALAAALERSERTRSNSGGFAIAFAFMHGQKEGCLTRAHLLLLLRLGVVHAQQMQDAVNHQEGELLQERPL